MDTTLFDAAVPEAPPCAGTVCYYSNRHLPYSETFIRSQGEALGRYRAYYLGSAPTAGGIALPVDRSATIAQLGRLSRLEDASLKLTGVAPRVAGLVRRLNPALFHVHFGPNALAGSHLARMAGVPLITTFHGYDVTIRTPELKAHGALHVLFGMAFARVIRENALVIAVSDYIRDRLIERGAPPDRVVRHYIGIDPDAFAPAGAPAGAAEREPFVLSVGRMVPYKAQEHLIEAMGVVQRHHPELELVLVGDGPERPALEALAAARLKRFRFLGAQPHDTVRSLMQRCRIYGQTSVELPNGQSEALALTLLEAQAAGAPTVAFDTGGMREAVAHGRTGFVVPARHVGALAGAIGRLAADDELCRSFARAGPTFVRERFDIRSQTRLLEDLYDTVLRDARRRGRPGA